MTMCWRFGVGERSSVRIEARRGNFSRRRLRHLRESKQLVRGIQDFDEQNLTYGGPPSLWQNGTRREDSEVRGKTHSPHHPRVLGGVATMKISAVQELLVAVLGVRMNSLVRLLGFTTLGCGCVTGHYREIATNREVTYVEEKGTTCNQNAHRRNHTVAPARFGMHALSAKAS
jgi:hypothetical protein